MMWLKDVRLEGKQQSELMIFKINANLKHPIILGYMNQLYNYEVGYTTS